jgi:SAM-dependent methyltransferase
MGTEGWNYFEVDRHYSDVHKDRLTHGVEMDSAKALAHYLDAYFIGDLRILDLGSGPGHYYPVIRKAYSHGSVRYTGVDIDKSNIDFGAKFFAEDKNVSLRVGSVLAPDIDDDINCVVSANTLPHVPSIEPLLRAIKAHKGVEIFVFRMLIGNECVETRKHLAENDFGDLFKDNYQLNNIYSIGFFNWLLGGGWNLSVEPDLIEEARLENHRLPEQDTNPFYGNRVSRSVGGLVFKGEVYMPWKFVVGKRC